MTQISTEELISEGRQIIQTELDALKILATQINASLADITQILLNCQGHILVAGAGTSRAVAQRFAHLLACCGSPGLFISAADALHGGAGAIGPNDVVYIISKGGRSAEINKFANIAKSRGAKIIAQTENPESPLGKTSDAVYQIVAPRQVDPYGMIATGSSLVNAAAGDVLCVLLLKLRGYTKEEFGQTHPAGAVGFMLDKEKQQ